MSTLLLFPICSKWIILIIKVIGASKYPFWAWSAQLNVNLVVCIYLSWQVFMKITIEAKMKIWAYLNQWLIIYSTKSLSNVDSAADGH